MKFLARKHAWVILPALVATVTGGCAATPAPHISNSESSAASLSPATPSPTPTALASLTASPSAPTARLEGLTIALDPGHNGGNFTHTRQINKRVPDGRDGKKACNTTGTATRSGYTESAFNWDVVQRLRRILEEEGAEIVLSRDSDDGVGPCVDERGTFANDADMMLSVHANSSHDTSIKGFFVILSSPPLAGEEVAASSAALADALVESLQAAGFPISPLGPISKRRDLSGLNHAKVPAALVELGEMYNPQEAALMETEEGRQRYAEALAEGIFAWAKAR